MVRRDARILVDADSAIVAATDAALDILGLTLEELRALPPGGLSLEQDRASSAEFAAAWESTGGGPILGAGTARLLDGRLIRVRYLVTPQADGTYEIILEQSEESVAEPPRAYTLGAVLSSWRAAERELAALEPDSGESMAVRAEIEHFRTEYQRLARGERQRLDGATDSGKG